MEACRWMRASRLAKQRVVGSSPGRGCGRSRSVATCSRRNRSRKHRCFPCGRSIARIRPLVTGGVVHPALVAPTASAVVSRRRPSPQRRLPACKASTGAARWLGRESNGGLCLRRFWRELAAGGVLRPFDHWRVRAPVVKLGPNHWASPVTDGAGLPRPRSRE